MKKSNKILVGGFLAGLLLLSGIHLTLYAKYKRGLYTVYDAGDELRAPSMQLFPNVLFVDISNLPGATVTLADVAEVETGGRDDVRCQRRGDTLLVAGREDAQPRGDDGYPLAIRLPFAATLSVVNSSLRFATDGKTANRNAVMRLSRSAVTFSAAGRPLRLGQLTIVAADSSAVLFHGPTQVDRLDLELNRSSFEQTEGDVGQLSIVTDSLSRLSLPSKLLIKATISHKP